MNLWQDFMLTEGKVVDKWHHYFPIYEKHLARFRNTTITFIEIGVSKGGSLAMWQRFFGPMATIVGLDINERCMEHEAPGIHVRIGDQSDETFLARVLEEFGTPDVILDDGSHVMKHVSASFNFLYEKMSKNGVYIVEDLHTAYWEEFGGGVDNPDTFINLSKHFIDDINAMNSRGKIAESPMTHSTFGISFYDGVIAFERGTVVPRTHSEKGSIRNFKPRSITKEIGKLLNGDK